MPMVGGLVLFLTALVGGSSQPLHGGGRLAAHGEGFDQSPWVMEVNLQSPLLGADDALRGRQHWLAQTAVTHPATTPAHPPVAAQAPSSPAASTATPPPAQPGTPHPAEAAAGGGGEEQQC